MQRDQKLRDLTSKFIQVLVWFELLWATVFFTGAVFRFSGLTDQLTTAFFGSGFCAVVVLVSMVLLNVTLNLNIISRAQATSAKIESAPTSPLSIGKVVGIALALIVVVVASIGIAEWRLYEKKIADVKVKLGSVAEAGLLQDAVKLINSDGKARELDRIREALSENIQSGSRLSLIFPQKVKDVDIYYEMHAWWYYQDNHDKISSANFPKFIPRNEEQKKWERMVKGDLDFFASVDDSTIRAFRRVKTDAGPIILLIDSSRREDYRRDWKLSS